MLRKMGGPQLSTPAPGSPSHKGAIIRPALPFWTHSKHPPSTPNFRRARSASFGTPFPPKIGLKCCWGYLGCGGGIHLCPPPPSE